MDHGALSLFRPPNVRTLMTGPVIHTSREIQPCVDLGERKVQDPGFPAWRMAPTQVEGLEAAYLPPSKLVDASFGAWSFTS